MESLPIISIVVPLYNAGLYIEKCLDSIFAQTLKDIDCIVVDDGSTDNGLNLCLDYSKREERLRVFHIENSGVCKARNVGIREARGKWISFIDSDDFIDPDYLESFMSFLHPNTLCVHRALRKIHADGHIEEIGLSDKDVYAGNSSADNYVLLNKNFLLLASSCFKMFSKEILRRNNIVFDESITCVEDRIFVAEYLLADEVKGISFIDECGYNYVMHKGSSTTVMPPLRMYADASLRWYHLIEKLNTKFNILSSEIVLKQKKYIKNQLIDVTLASFKHSRLNLSDRFQLYKHLKAMIDKEFGNVRLERGYDFVGRIIKLPSLVGFVIFNIRFHQ